MLVDILKKIEDPRSYHGKEYQLWQILLCTILCILANGKTYSDIKTFIDVHYEKLSQIFNFKWRRMPDQSAIRKIIVRVDPEEIEYAFREHAQICDENSQNNEIDQPKKHVCFDGKVLNGSFSHTKDKRAFQVFSAFATKTNITLGHIYMDPGKDHEIQAFQQFLSELDLKDVVVTVDSLHCQKKLLKKQIKPAQILSFN